MLKKIVVGTDGSANAGVALHWAVEEAGVHGAQVEAVLVWSLLDQHHADGDDRFDPGYDQVAAEAAVAAYAVVEANEVATRAVCDLPVRALLEAGDTADMLVVGARGKGGFDGLLLGAVSERLVEQSSLPVVVIRASAPVRGGRVVVGVDGSRTSRDALRWAAVEARARDADLDVVHGWRRSVLPASPWIGMYPDLGDLESAGREILDDVLADPALDGLRVHAHLAHGTAGRALVERAEGAGLVVVGSRGLGRLSGALLGSVSRQVVHHAPCPVAVL